MLTTSVTLNDSAPSTPGGDLGLVPTGEGRGHLSGTQGHLLRSAAREASSRSRSSENQKTELR